MGNKSHLDEALAQLQKLNLPTDAHLQVIQILVTLSIERYNAGIDMGREIWKPKTLTA
jgi:hypothetical protein